MQGFPGMAKQGPSLTWQAMLVYVKPMGALGTVFTLHLAAGVSCRTSQRLAGMHYCCQLM